MNSKVEAAIADLGNEWQRFKDHHVGMIGENRRRVETLEARAQMVGAGNGEHFDRKATDAFLRDVIDRKAVTLGSATGGGNAQPEVLSRMIQAQIPRYSPLMDLVLVEDTASADYHKIVTDLGHGSGWVGEGGTRSETDTALMQRVSPTFGTVYSRPKASEESMNDIFFNVTDWFVAETAKQHGKQIGEAIINGDGSDKPTGFLQATAESTADFGASPERAFGNIEYIPTGTADTLGGDRLSSPQGNAGDNLIDCFYALNAAHRQEATWVMNSASFAAVRKLKDADGDYIWQRGFGVAGEILGRPVVVAEGMPDVAANSYPIAVADWKAAYILARVSDFKVTVDDNITTPGQVILYARQRYGGKLLDSNAIKLIKCATS